MFITPWSTDGGTIIKTDGGTLLSGEINDIIDGGHLVDGGRIDFII